MRVAVLTISDGVAAGAKDDLSGKVLGDAAEAAGLEVSWRGVVADEQATIAGELARLCDDDVAELVLTTGGTGFAPRDVTPEATRAVLERLSPGIDEALRADAIARFPHGMLSRGVSGTRGRTFVVNLPGSPKACAEGFQVLAPVLEHAVSLLRAEPTAHPKEAT
ncbi:MAG TPA: MogA/MoaB family molybdenum cofactor biosynthesis protein [Gaiellales bacterium]|jgi:molybdenum cofactor synthesis domain-containing protein